MIDYPRLENALCREVDPEVFFPDPHTRSASVFAISICQKCSEMLNCQAYALRHNDIDWGVWGGVDIHRLRREEKHGKVPVS